MLCLPVSTRPRRLRPSPNGAPSCLRRHRPSRTGRPSWSISREGASAPPPHMGFPRPPPAISYRRTQLVHLPGGAPALPPSIGSAYAPSAKPEPPPDVSYRCTDFVHLSRGASAMPTYIGNAHVASGHLLTGNPLGASPRRGSNHASLHGHAHAPSVHLLPSHLVGASHWRGSLPCSLDRQGPRPLRTSPPAPFHHATPPSVGSPTPPPAAS